MCEFEFAHRYVEFMFGGGVVEGELLHSNENFDMNGHCEIMASINNLGSVLLGGSDEEDDDDESTDNMEQRTGTGDLSTNLSTEVTHSDKCCGTYPNVKPYFGSSSKKQCCGLKLYDEMKHQCCDTSMGLKIMAPGQC